MKNQKTRAAIVERALLDFEGRLLRYAARTAPDPETARDVVQETLLRLWRVELAPDPEMLAPWLYKVCRRLAIDARRRGGRMATVSPAILDERAGGAEPALAAERSDAHASAQQWIATLGEREQEAIRLKFQEGLPYKEIAEVMEITTSYVGVLIHEGLKKVRKKMGAARVGVQPVQEVQR